MKKIITSIVTGASNVAAEVAAVSACGTVSGLSAAGVTSGLTAIGGSMVGGIIVLGTTPLVAVAAAVGICAAVEHCLKD